MRLTAHPIANKFPLLIHVPFDELVADVTTGGLRELTYLCQAHFVHDRKRFGAASAAAKTPVDFRHRTKTLKALLDLREAAWRRLVVGASQAEPARLIRAGEADRALPADVHKEPGGREASDFAELRRRA